MTEDEAKTKWCPYSTARVIRWQKRADTTVNAVYGEPPTTLCVASQCMAWRWSVGRNTGFCGLAGQLS